MNEPKDSPRVDTDKAALDDLADLYRLPNWRIDGSQSGFIAESAEIIRRVRDLSGPPSPEVLLENRWAYDPDRDRYDDLDEERMKSMTCDFCERIFYADEEHHYRGLRGALREDPDDPDGGCWVQTICELCVADDPPGVWPENLQRE